MIVGLELGKEYIQICVKTDAMTEPESVATVLGTESYRIPTEADPEKTEDLQGIFRKMLKWVTPYGSRDAIQCLVVCLEEGLEHLRENVLETGKIYDIRPETIHFLDRKECFCTYLFHQTADLFAHNVLLVENVSGEKRCRLLHKHANTRPVVAEVHDLPEQPLEDIFREHAISSVFLVGDDFEEAWMEQNLRILRSGKRIFLGKNLFVKGAAYYGMELLEGKTDHLYLGEEKVRWHLALNTLENGKETYLPVTEGGKNWYESDTYLEVLLLDTPELEFTMLPLHGQEKKTTRIVLTGLPKRPERTTRLGIEIHFTGPALAKIKISDLGFGELFPQSDLVYEGELQWEQ